MVDEREVPDDLSEHNIKREAIEAPTRFLTLNVRHHYVLVLNLTALSIPVDILDVWRDAGLTDADPDPGCQPTETKRCFLHVRDTELVITYFDPTTENMVHAFRAPLSEVDRHWVSGLFTVGFITLYVVTGVDVTTRDIPGDLTKAMRDHRCVWAAVRLTT
jgi:hypothetical protein